jgi:hypothetical protein
MAKMMFKGKETMKEEKAEKKVSPAAYKRGEKMEGEKFANGGMPGKKGGMRPHGAPSPMMYADGGMAEYCGYRSEQDYGKKGK